VQYLFNVQRIPVCRQLIRVSGSLRFKPCLIRADAKVIFDVPMKKETLKSRAERSNNVTPVQPYDLTSNAYRPELRKSTPKNDFGLALSLAVVVVIMIFFFFVYEAVISGYERVK
jgi:hypothetical protein